MPPKPQPQETEPEKPSTEETISPVPGVGEIQMSEFVDTRSDETKSEDNPPPIPKRSSSRTPPAVSFSVRASQAKAHLTDKYIPVAAQAEICKVLDEVKEMAEIDLNKLVRRPKRFDGKSENSKIWLEE